MNNEKSERLEILRQEKVIWIISIFLAIGALTSSILEAEDLKNDSTKNRSTYRTINLIVFIIALLIYVYFIQLFYKAYQETPLKRILLTLVGSILAFIGTLLFLIAEILNIIDDEKRNS